MEELKDHKIIVTDTILHRISYKKPFTFGEILGALETELQPDDEIYQHWEEPYEGSVEAYDGHWSLTVTRERLETDEEFAVRQEKLKKMREEARKKQYEHYLKLKAKFENEEE